MARNDNTQYPIVPYYNPTGQQAGKSGIFDIFGPDKVLFNKFGTGKSKLGELFKNIRATKLFGENGPKIGTAANVIGGAYQGINAIQNLTNNANIDKDYNTLKRDINTAIASNPMYDMYLDASDERLLRQMKNGSLTNNVQNAVSGVMNNIPQAALSALIGGITGGIPGAAIQGLGSLGNAAISGYSQGTQDSIAQLQGLYDKLRRADEDYRSMKRPYGLREAGLQTQYYNQLY